MGACFDAVFVNTTDKVEAGKKLEHILEEDRYENGHSYSGSIGMVDGYKFTDKAFDSPISAENWLQENAEKWGPALGVRVTTDKGHDGWFFGAICPS